MFMYSLESRESRENWSSRFTSSRSTERLTKRHRGALSGVLDHSIDLKITTYQRSIAHFSLPMLQLAGSSLIFSIYVEDNPL